MIISLSITGSSRFQWELDFGYVFCFPVFLFWSRGGPFFVSIVSVVEVSFRFCFEGEVESRSCKLGIKAYH